MMARHAGLARELGAQLGLPEAVLDALAGSYERWDGRGWPGELGRRRDPDRVAGRAARGVRRGRAPRRWHRRRGRARRAPAGHAVRPAARRHAAPRRGEGLRPDRRRGLVGRRDRCRAVAGDRARPSSECDDALRAIGRFVDLKSPFTIGHSVAVAELAAAAGRQLGLADDEVHTLYRAGLVHDFGRLGVSNSIWDKRGPLGAGEWERVRLHPYFTERMLRQSPTLAPLARDRRPAPRAARRLRLPARPDRQRDLAARARPGRGRRLPGHARAAAVPRPARPPPTRRPSCAATCGPVGSSPTRSRRCSPPPVIASCAAAKARPG